MIEHKLLNLPEALSLVTENVAKNIGQTGQKGSIRVGADADLLILTHELTIRSVLAKGQLMKQDGVILYKNQYM